MRHVQQQTGSLLISVIVLIVIASFLGVTIMSLYITNLKNTSELGSADYATFLADSGLDKGIRGWAQDPTYTGEGPLTLGQGSFTITASDFDADGNALPADQKRIISTGTVDTPFGTASRTLDVIAAYSVQGLLDESFPDISSWSGSGSTPNSFCPAGTGGTLVQDSEGTVSHDPGNDAQGAASGSFLAQVTAGRSGERLSGYREYTFAGPIPANSKLAIDFWREKDNGNPAADIINMAFDLVATDGTLYRLWSDCATSGNMSWSAVTTIDWTVPNGVEIDRVRLAYEIQNQVKTSGSVKSGAYIAFDDITITSVGGLVW